MVAQRSLRVGTGPAAVTMALLCSACAATPFKPPPADLPDQFEQSAAPAAGWPSSEWYRAFASDELIALIAQADSTNLDLAAAQARIRQADARAHAAGAAILPTVDAGASVNDIRGRAGGQSAHEIDWSALLSASYEVDFWGRNRSAAQSARLQAAASRADRDVIALTTVAGVANGYFDVLSLRERLAIANSNLETTRQILRAIEARYDAGIASPVELATQRAAEANAMLVIAPLMQSEVEARTSLALLLGRRPEEFTVMGATLEDIAVPVVAAGLPSELLMRRPDITSAELNLRAAHADVDAARAALFPNLTLTANGGVQNPGVQAAVITLAGTGYTLGLGASLVQTIFDGGRRRAAREEASAREEELLATYRTSILDALRDVEVALSAVHHLDLQADAHRQNVQQSTLAFQGAEMRYRAGSGDFLTMLEAQRTLYAARDQQSQYRLARLQALVGIYRALGGGWPDATAR
jgi:multidrug efflux system outer membrane protein